MADRDGAGPEYQARPSEAWRIHRGRLECFEEGGDRSLLLLTRGLADRRATVKMSIRLGRLEPKSVSRDGWVGFRLGLREDHAEGLNAGITSDGRLFIGAPEKGTPLLSEPLDNLKMTLEWVQGWLSIEVNQIRVSKNLARSDTTGGIALVCGAGAGRFWFRDWTSAAAESTITKTVLPALPIVNSSYARRTGGASDDLAPQNPLSVAASPIGRRVGEHGGEEIGAGQEIRRPSACRGDQCPRR